jgi:DNA-binding winged helix-turn-helix (wHTH) protein
MIHRFGLYELEPELFELRRDGERVALAPKAMDLLRTLVEHRERVMTKRELLERVWPGVTVGENALTRVAMELRKALGDDGESIVATVRGRGYRFVAEIAPSEPPPAAPAATIAPTLVGREAEVALASARIDDVVGRRGAALVITGEAGIGKSRLLEEVASMARARGLPVLGARCRDDDDAPPLWAVIELVRPLPAGRELGEALASTDGKQRFLARDRAQAAVERASPTVVVVDDADRASVETVRFLAGLVESTARAPLLLVVAHRSGDASAAVADVSAAVARRGGRTCTLAPLSRDDVAKLVPGLSPPVLARLVEKTGGNPLLVHQLQATSTLDADSEGATLQLDAGVRDAIGHQLAALSPDCRHVLSVAAVLGREFSLGVLSTVTGRPTPELLDRCAEAVSARILARVAGAGGQHRFPHALVRDALYQTLAPSERAALHGAAAVAKVRAFESPDASQRAAIALHFERGALAGHGAAAVAWLLGTAEQRRDAGDDAEARVLAEVLLRVLETHPDAVARAKARELVGGRDRLQQCRSDEPAAGRVRLNSRARARARTCCATPSTSQRRGGARDFRCLPPVEFRARARARS